MVLYMWHEMTFLLCKAQCEEPNLKTVARVDLSKGSTVYTVVLGKHTQNKQLQCKIDQSETLFLFCFHFFFVPFPRHNEDLTTHVTSSAATLLRASRTRVH